MEEKVKPEIDEIEIEEVLDVRQARTQMHTTEANRPIKETKIDAKSDKKEDSSNSSNWWKIIGVVFFLVIIAVVFYFLTSGKDTTNNNPDQFTYTTGFTFTKVQNYWMTRIQAGNTSYDIPFRHNPYEVENITVEGNLKDYAAAYRKYGYSYMTLDNWDEGGEGYLSMSVNEVSKMFDKVIGTQVIGACTSDNLTGSCAAFNFSTKRCNNTKEPVVYLKLDNETKIIGEKNCITIQGSGEDLVKATDKLFYYWFGIMKENSTTTEVQNKTTLRKVNASELDSLGINLTELQNKSKANSTDNNNTNSTSENKTE